MTPAPFPLLRTPRLVLRELVPADAAAVFKIHGNAELMRWFGNDPLADMAGAHRLISEFAGWRMRANPGTRWAIQTTDDPQLLGTCGLFAWNRDWRKCAVGYELDAAAQGRGYMREALHAVVSWGFAHMALNRVEALIHPDNERSVRLARGLGFVCEGRLRQVGFWGGRFHDMAQYALLRQDWGQVAGES